MGPKRPIEPEKDPYRPIEFKVIRSGRRTLSLQITGEGAVVVRAPYGTPASELRRFVAAHRSWLEKHRSRIERAASAAEAEGKFTPVELQNLREEASRIIPPRVSFWAERMGVTCHKITVRCQRTRWGSCSAQGNLNFNCLLMLTPPEVLDSVIIHELAHRRHMDHSPAFYSEVLRYCPEYRQRNAWLKCNGPVLMKRLPDA